MCLPMAHPRLPPAAAHDVDKRNQGERRGFLILLRQPCHFAMEGGELERERGKDDWNKTTG